MTQLLKVMGLNYKQITADTCFGRGRPARAMIGRWAWLTDDVGFYGHNDISQLITEIQQLASTLG